MDLKYGIRSLLAVMILLALLSALVSCNDDRSGQSSTDPFKQKNDLGTQNTDGTESNQEENETEAVTDETAEETEDEYSKNY